MFVLVVEFHYAIRFLKFGKDNNGSFKFGESQQKQCIIYKALGFKGQKKSKWFFPVNVSSNKQMNEQILIYYYETSGWLVWFPFYEETKKTFRS